ILRVKDAKAADADLTAMGAMLQPTPVTIGGVRYHVIAMPDLPTVSYGLKGDWLYLVTGRAERVLGSAADSSLLDNARYALVQDVVDKDSTAMFADLYGIRQIVEDTLSADELTEYRAKVRPFVAPFWAIVA